MDPKSQESFRIIDNRDLPPLYITRLHYSYIEESVPLTLWRVAVKSTVRQTGIKHQVQNANTESPAEIEWANPTASAWHVSSNVLEAGPMSNQ